MAGRSNGSPPAEPAKKYRPALVEVEPARRGEITRTLALTGEVVATDSVVIAAIKEGPISSCPCREGDTVEKGKTLVEIDRAVHRAEVGAAAAALSVARAKLADLKAGARPEEIQKAEANIRKWQATLDEARETYRRQTDLIKKDFTSKQSVDQARERMAVAEAELAAARETLSMLKAGPTATEVAVQTAAVEEAAARMALARAHLAECVIAAPFDGMIAKVHVRVGDLATPRTPLLEMYAPASLVVRFAVSEAHAAAIRPGLPLTATLDALPDRTLTGKVVRAYPQLDSAMRTRTVEAKLDPAAKLMPHQFARLTLELGSADDAVIIPAQAVIETPQGDKIVFVIEAGKAMRRKVTLGIEGKQSVQVVEGIAAGEPVVVTGNEGLKDGAPVRVAGAGEGPRKPGHRAGAGSSPPDGAEGGR